MALRENFVWSAASTNSSRIFDDALRRPDLPVIIIEQSPVRVDAGHGDDAEIELELVDEVLRRLADDAEVVWPDEAAGDDDFAGWGRRSSMAATLKLLVMTRRPA